MPLLYSIIKKYNEHKESKMNSKSFMISNSLLTNIFGCIVELVFSIIIIFVNIFVDVNIMQNIVLLTILLCLVILTIATVRERVVVKNNSIVYTTAFGKTKKCEFNDIKYISEIVTNRGIVSYTVYSEKKLFVFSNTQAGAKLLVDRIKQLNIPIQRIIR